MVLQKDSRPHDVAAAIAAQAVAALHLLTRGLGSADLACGESLLRGALRQGSSDLHRGLVATLLRMVFVLHAEDRGLLPRRLEAAATSPGAWAALGALFRAIHAGGEDEDLVRRARGGRLFDPDAHPFLEARALLAARAVGDVRDGESTPAAAIEDGVVVEVLALLVRVDGERLAYRTLDLQHLGNIYEAIIGFTIEIATEPSVVLRAQRKPGAAPADPAVGLLTLLGRAPAERVATLGHLGVELPGTIARAVRGARDVDALVAALSKRTSSLSPGVLPPGSLLLQPTDDRRRSGSHFTSSELADATVVRTLEPLLAELGEDPDPEAILALRVCDPAMGSGAFLVAACRALGDAVVDGWTRRGGIAPVHLARRLVAERCLYGLDKDPFAVELARLSLWLFTRAADLPFTFLDHSLRHGDALVGLAAAPTCDPADVAHAPLSLRASFEAAAARCDSTIAVVFGAPAEVHTFHWPLELPEVFAPDSPTREGPHGFDACVGNPPWVSYAGRASQPLAAGHRAWFEAHFTSFAGFRNLQGVFVERGLSLLRPGGRLGFVLPSSMSEQQGYAPSRRAHDRMAACDEELRDVGEDAFRGVFQPSMVLTSTRRAAPTEADGAPWPMERPDLDGDARACVARMTAGPPLPPDLFGERGLQSSGEDLSHLATARDAVHDRELRAGGDIRAFFRGPPSFFADRRWFGSRLRSGALYGEVRLLIRQTSAYPIVTLSDGLAFRNSILAGFDSADHPAAFLAAYLNATPIRWLHFVRHRDARQGMPQLKIGHLRATPAPPRRELVAALERVGAELATRNLGVRPEEQAVIDALVADAFGLEESERARIGAWARQHVKDAGVVSLPR